MPCLFCKIANKEIPSEVLFETSEVLAFFDIHPIAPGHLMIIPKFHAENILEVPEEKMGDILSAVKKGTEILKKALAPDGFTIGINHGKVSGQEIDHLHVHIIPRFSNDGGKSLHGVVSNPPKESVADLAEQIRQRAL